MHRTHAPRRAAMVIATLLAAALTLGPVGARADATAAAANQLAIEQGIDCLSTLAIMREGGWERDPIAAPFVRSPVAMVGAAVALNLLLRRHATVNVLHTLVAIYPVILLGNARAVAAPAGVAGLVKR